ncbi:MAG: ribonuclease III [Clostridiales bacterium]|nr:ribonuclease III [Clostridiales bacterium]
MNENLIRELNGSALAYLGDAVFEVLVRKYLLSCGISSSGKLNKLALSFVRATAQSAALDNILPLLTENEEYIYKRGRNANGIAIPRSASAVEYRRATGFEALFGYLDLTGQSERAEELFKLAYVDVIKSIENPDAADNGK